MSPRKSVTCLFAFVFLLTSLAAGASDEPEMPQLVPEACFAEGTPDEVVTKMYSRLNKQRLINSKLRTSLDAQLQKFTFDDNDRWTTTATDPGPLGQGDPTTLTWGFVPDGTSIFGYIGEPTAPSNLQAWLNGIYGSQAVWQALFQEVFDRWGELTGITYVYEPNDDGSPWTQFNIAPGVLGVRADIRIAGHFLDGTSGTLAYNFFPDFGDMVFDTGDATYNNTSNNSLILRNVIAHEHGHGMGISHVCPVNQTKLMEPFLSTAFDGPQFDDILAANRGYGDDLEHNDTPGTATSVGSITPGAGVSLGNLSNDDNSDLDYLTAGASNGTQMTVTATPLTALVSPYLSGPQNPVTGACTPGTPYNPLDNQDLQIQILDVDGTTVLGSANLTGAGFPETLSGVNLSSGAGVYYVNIDGGSNNEAQMYQVDIDIDPVPGGYIHTVTPGTAGTTNTFAVSGATPGATTFLIYGFTEGQINVPGCPNAVVGMGDITILSQVVADAAGNASFSLFLGAGASGATVRLQAVELSTCLVSNLVVNTF